MDAFTIKNWVGMIGPRSLEPDVDTLRSDYGRFIAKPLERGYGLTLGNSLRRVLLSSLQGAGIVAVKIDGVDHEFGTIQNVKEEVSEIILNLKELQFKLVSEEEVFVMLEKSGEGSVTGGDIKINNARLEVLNPDHVICNISSGGSLRAELKISRGKGYVMAGDNQEMYDLPVGWIYLDTLFSPVTRVNYTVTNARVGKRTDYDRLSLEVWTNAGVEPQDAVAFAAKILRDQLTVFLNFADCEELPREDSRRAAVGASSSMSDSQEFLLKPVNELELSVRSANCLQNANIKYIYELVSKTEGEMLRTKNFGRKSLNEIKEILSRLGLGLGMKVDSLMKQIQDKDGGGSLL